MTPTEFCYWLQGFMELHQPEKLDARQTKVIQDHLALVFQKETPERVLESKDPFTNVLGPIKFC